MGKITNQILEQALELRKKGHAYSSIAEELGVAESTLFKRLKKLETPNSKEVNTESENGIPSTVRSKMSSSNKEKTNPKIVNMDTLEYLLQIGRLENELSRAKENANRDLRDAEKDYQRLRERYKEAEEKNEKLEKELTEIKDKNESLKKQASILNGIGNYVLPIMSSPLGALFMEKAGILPKGMDMQAIEGLHTAPQEQQEPQIPEHVLQDHQSMQGLRDAFKERFQDLVRIVNLLAQKPHEINYVLNYLQTNPNSQDNG